MIKSTVFHIVSKIVQHPFSDLLANLFREITNYQFTETLEAIARAPLIILKYNSNLLDRVLMMNSRMHE